MSSLRFFNVIFVLLGVTSTISASTYPYVGQHSLLPVTPYFIYTSSKPSAVFNGYSYATQDFNGGASNVVYTSGPNAAEKLRMQLQSNNMQLYQQMTEGNMEMNMQNMPQETAALPMPESMESDMQNMPQQNLRASPVQNEAKPGMDEGLEKRNQLRQQQMLFSQDHVFYRKPLNLYFPRTTSRLYVVPQSLGTPHYSHSNIAQFGISPYTHNNPFLPVFYQSPFVSDINAFHRSSFSNKDSRSFNIESDQSLQFNCTNLKVNNINSNVNKTPASEYVANAVEKASMNNSAPLTESTSTTTNPTIITSTDQSGTTESSNNDIKNGTSTMATEATTMTSSMTNTTEI